MNNAQRAIRLIGRSAEELDRIMGATGEIYFDSTSNTLRLYTSRTQGGVALATRGYVTSRGYITNSALTGLATETFVTDAIDAIPAVDFTGLATESFVTDAIDAIPAVDFTGLATEEFVTDAIDAIPAVDFTGLATETFVGTAISNLVDSAPTTLNTLNELAAALGDDANYATTITTALGLKAPIANPTFTGTVGGITATMVGLGSVTNESKATMFTSPTFTGTTTLQQSTEVLNVKTGATGTVTHDFTTGAIWYHSSAAANFTANFTNVPTTNSRAISAVLVVYQNTGPYLPTAVEIDGAAQTILWQEANTPGGTLNQVDIVSFTFIRVSSSWVVLGSVSTYGAP